MGAAPEEMQERFDAAAKTLMRMVQEEPCLIFSTTVCPWCDRAKEFFEAIQKPCRKVELDLPRGDEERQMLGYALSVVTKQRTVPNIFLGGKHLGGYDVLMEVQRRCKAGQMAAEHADVCGLVTE